MLGENEKLGWLGTAVGWKRRKPSKTMNAAGHDEDGRRHERSSSGASKRGRRTGEVRKLVGQRGQEMVALVSAPSQLAYRVTAWGVGEMVSVGLLRSEVRSQLRRWTTRQPAANIRLRMPRSLFHRG